jgi:hypothetical protein
VTYFLTIRRNIFPLIPMSILPSISPNISLGTYLIGSSIAANEMASRA